MGWYEDVGQVEDRELDSETVLVLLVMAAMGAVGGVCLVIALLGIPIEQMDLLSMFCVIAGVMGILFGGLCLSQLGLNFN